MQIISDPEKLKAFVNRTGRGDRRGREEEERVSGSPINSSKIMLIHKHVGKYRKLGFRRKKHCHSFHCELELKHFWNSNFRRFLTFRNFRREFVYHIIRAYRVDMFAHKMGRNHSLKTIRLRIEMCEKKFQIECVTRKNLRNVKQKMSPNVECF